MVAGLDNEQRTPTSTRPTSPTCTQDMAEEMGFSAIGAAVSNLSFTINAKNTSGGGSLGTSAAGGGKFDTIPQKRGRSAGPAGASADSNTRSKSSGRGRSATGMAEGRGRSRAHWRSISSSFSNSADRDRDRNRDRDRDRDRPSSSNLHVVDTTASPLDQTQHQGIGLRRPSTAASTSSARTATSGNTLQNAFNRVFAPLSTSAPSSRGSITFTRPSRSRSASPGAPPAGAQFPQQPQNPITRGTVPQLSPAHSQSYTSLSTVQNSSEAHQSPTSPTSGRTSRFPKLAFPTSRDRSRTGLVSASLVSLSSSIAEALVDKTKGVYATKPLPPVYSQPVQALNSVGSARGGQYDDHQNGNYSRTDSCGGGGNGGSGTIRSPHAWKERHSPSTPELRTREGEVEIMGKALSSM